MPSPSAPTALQDALAGEPRLRQLVLSRTDPSRSRLSALPAEQLWTAKTPKALAAAWREAADTDGWEALQGHLSKNPDHQSYGAEFGDSLLWGAASDETSDETSNGPSNGPFAAWHATTSKLLSVAAKNHGKKKSASSANALVEHVDNWCDSSQDRPVTVGLALECVTLAAALPRLAAFATHDTWWRLAEQLDAIATNVAGARPGEDARADDLLIDQLLGGELPLRLATVLPTAKPWQALGKQARRSLTEGVLSWTDGEGLPPGRGVQRLGLVAACWTRCRRLADRAGVRCWDAAAQTQYEWMVRQLVRLADRRGRLLLGPASSDAGLLRAALDTAGDPSDHAAAATRLGDAKLLKSTTKRAAAPPDPSINSEWSGLSLLAAGWGRKRPRLLATYDELECQLAMNNLGHPVISGAWRTSITIDGAPVATDGGWEEQCWFSDEDCDYLEYAIDLEGGGRLERIVLLAKQDDAAMIADLVHTGRSGETTVEVETRFALGNGVAFSPTEETREGWLVSGERRLAGVVPPAMAEWRADPRGGEMTSDGGDLVLHHEAVGSAIACPLWLDLKPKRFAKQRTWRQLTVAQALEPVRSDVAVGFRIQSGKDQWLLYRSLARKANRTVMGQNYSSESFFGRFDPATGLAEEYFEVEA